MAPQQQYFLCCFTPTLLLLLLLFSLTIPAAGSNNSATAASIDLLIRNRAFRALPLHRTGSPYHVHLPANLSAVTATAVRLRGADLWLRSVNISSFRLPPGIFTGPYARRTLLVFNDFGNLSSYYYGVPGYVLVAPVVGCLAYDASNVSFAREGAIKELSLRPTQDSIWVSFPAAALPVGDSMRCVWFGPYGSVQVGAVVEEGMRCKATGTGHFSVVVPAAVLMSPPQTSSAEAGVKRWWVWAAVGGGVVLVVGLLVAAGVRRMARKRRMEEMERRAVEGEVLDNVWVGGSKMPSAAMARTLPAIENESVPCASVT